MFEGFFRLLVNQIRALVWCFPFETFYLYIHHIHKSLRYTIVFVERVLDTLYKVIGECLVTPLSLLVIGECLVTPLSLLNVCLLSDMNLISPVRRLRKYFGNVARLGNLASDGGHLPRTAPQDASWKITVQSRNLEDYGTKPQSGRLRYEDAMWKRTVQGRKTTWHLKAYNPRNL